MVLGECQPATQSGNMEHMSRLGFTAVLVQDELLP